MHDAVIKVDAEQQKYIEMGIAAAKDRQLDELNAHLKDIAQEFKELNKTLKEARYLLYGNN